MKKGIVMEINDAYLTLLTPDGEFLRARKQKQPYTIGEEILFFPIELKKTTRHHSLLTKMLSVKSMATIAVAFILFFGSILFSYQNNKAYAYMSIDVNPSIELVMNKEMRVLKIKAYNQDGKKIIDRLGDWKKKDIAELTQSLLKEMKRQGYLKDHHVVVISTVRADKKEPAAEKELAENMKEIEKTIEDNALQLTVLNGTPNDLEKAHELGITTGKYKERKQKQNEKELPASQQEQSSKNPDGSIQNQPAAVPPQQPVPQTEKPEVNTRPAVPEAIRPSAPQPHPVQKNGQTAPGNSGQSQKKPIPPGQLKKIDEIKEKVKETKDQGEKEINQNPYRQEDHQAEKEEKKTLNRSEEQLDLDVKLPLDVQIKINGSNKHE